MSAHLQSPKYTSGFEQLGMNTLTRVVAGRIPSHHVPSLN